MKTQNGWTKGADNTYTTDGFIPRDKIALSLGIDEHLIASVAYVGQEYWDAATIVSVAPEAVNLTPHAITVRMANGEVTYPPSGTVARVQSASVPLSAVNGIPVVRNVWGEVSGLPSIGEVGDNIYIVSSLVLGRLGEEWRGIAVAPATGPHDNAIRNDAGQIVAVTQFVTV